MKIDEAYDNWALQYDSNVNRTRDLDQEATIQTLSRYKFRKVLELGCGTGKNTMFLSKHAVKVIALDFSKEMLQVAKEKINSQNVDFKHVDINMDWEVESNAFDLVTASLTLEHVENLNHIFAQSCKALKVKGLFFISELHPFKQYLGSRAKFESKTGTVELEVFIHNLSEFLDYANLNGFKLLELKEWFDYQSKDGIPNLVSFVFEKSD